MLEGSELCELAARYGLGAALYLPYIPQTLDTEWNQGCQPSQLQGGEGLWLYLVLLDLALPVYVCTLPINFFLVYQ